MEERGLSPAPRLSTVAGFYRFAVIDGAIEHSPAEYVRRPKIDTESATLGLDRMELGAFIARGSAGSVVDQTLASLLGPLGLRISEALHIDIEHLGIQRGHRTVTVLGKGSKLAVIPLPPRVARAVDLTAGERTCGPLLLGRNGDRLNRQAATRIVVRLAKQAGVSKHISPHSLRHSFISRCRSLSPAGGSCGCPWGQAGAPSSGSCSRMRVTRRVGDSLNNPSSARRTRAS